MDESKNSENIAAASVFPSRVYPLPNYLQLGLQQVLFRVLHADQLSRVYSSPEPVESPHNEKRKGSIFADATRRKESIAALTENVTGEYVNPPPPPQDAFNDRSLLIVLTNR